MEIYRSGKFSLTFSREMELELNRLRMECMAEDTVAGRIQDYLDNLEDDYRITFRSPQIGSSCSGASRFAESSRRQSRSD